MSSYLWNAYHPSIYDCARNTEWCYFICLVHIWYHGKLSRWNRLSALKRCMFNVVCIKSHLFQDKYLTVSTNLVQVFCLLPSSKLFHCNLVQNWSSILATLGGRIFEMPKLFKLKGYQNIVYQYTLKIILCLMYWVGKKELWFDQQY